MQGKESAQKYSLMREPNHEESKVSSINCRNSSSENLTSPDKTSQIPNSKTGGKVAPVASEFDDLH